MGYNRNDFKISFDGKNTQFFVNEKKGTVACVLTGYMDTPYDVDNCVDIQPIVIKETGIAKCADGDTFDAERGKRIALAKAENRVYMTAMRYLDIHMKHIMDMVTAYNKFSDKAYRTCGHNEDYISSLSYEAHPRYIKELKPMKRGR
jgi:hypothetical protein